MVLGWYADGTRLDRDGTRIDGDGTAVPGCLADLYSICNLVIIQATIVISSATRCIKQLIESEPVLINRPTTTTYNKFPWLVSEPNIANWFEQVHLRNSYN